MWRALSESAVLSVAQSFIESAQQATQLEL
jgi:hypothetical protein